MGEMAVKRVRKTVKHVEPVVEEPVMSSEVFETPAEPKKKFPMFTVGAAVLLAAGLVFFWYKTNSWPIVAMVGLRPVTRFEIAQGLFARGGKSEIDNRVLELQVQEEFRSRGVKVTSQEVDAKIEEIKKNLGPNADLETILSARGLTMTDYRRQLELLLGAEKAVSANVTISDEEVNSYLASNKESMINASGEASLAEAREAVRLTKVDEQIKLLIEQVKSKYKAWVLPGY